MGGKREGVVSKRVDGWTAPRLLGKWKQAGRLWDVPVRTCTRTLSVPAPGTSRFGVGTPPASMAHSEPCPLDPGYSQGTRLLTQPLHSYSSP